MMTQDDMNQEKLPVQPQDPFIFSRLKQSDIPNGMIKQKHIENSALLIFTGLDANLPLGTGYEKAFFATDTFKLYIWTGSAWKSTTLT